MITYRLTFEITLKRVLDGTLLFANITDFEEESLLKLITHVFFDDYFDFHNNLFGGIKVVFVKLDNKNYIETISQDELDKTYLTIKKLMMLK